MLWSNDRRGLRPVSGRSISGLVIVLTLEKSASSPVQVPLSGAGPKAAVSLPAGALPSGRSVLVPQSIVGPPNTLSPPRSQSPMPSSKSSSKTVSDTVSVATERRRVRVELRLRSRTASAPCGARRPAPSRDLRAVGRGDLACRGAASRSTLMLRLRRAGLPVRSAHDASSASAWSAKSTRRPRSRSSPGSRCARPWSSRCPDRRPVVRAAVDEQCEAVVGHAGVAVHATPVIGEHLYSMSLTLPGSP